MACDGADRSVFVARIAALLVATTICSCGGGGGSGGSFSPKVQLLAVTFPDPGDVNVETEDVAPRDAPLLQQVVFTFDAAPDPNRVSSLTLPIRGPDGLYVAGRYDVDDVTVTFTPVLPLRPIVPVGDTAWDSGGTSLRPNASYTVRVGPLNFRALQAACGDVSPSVLQRRLHELRRLGLIEKIPRLGYRLSARGERLFQVLVMLNKWSGELRPGLQPDNSTD